MKFPSFSAYLRKKHNIQFIKWRPVHVGFSLSVIVLSLLLFFFKGLNYGIDFKGGILFEVESNAPNQIGVFRDEIAKIGVGEVSIQEFGNPSLLLIRMGSAGAGATIKEVETIKEQLKPLVKEFRRIETVGPSIGDELKKSAAYSVLGAMFLMMVYIWFRFEWQFGLGAIVALIHDVVGTVGMFALFQIEFNLVSVAALLTIAGYSINDTVVIYDRVRENLQKYKQKSLDDVFNLSINETLSRTILTSTTTLVSMIALAFFGGSAIHDFGYAMSFGIVIGTYSSIALALPVVNLFEPKSLSYNEIFSKPAKNTHE